MKSLENIISRIPSKRRITEHRYHCKCPAHDDSTESLTVSFNPDTGKTLMHCFAGCSSLAVLHAIGLELQDLFEDDRHDYVPANTDSRERWLCRKQEHLIERAIDRVHLTNAWVKSGRELTQEEAQKYQNAYMYLERHDMLPDFSQYEYEWVEYVPVDTKPRPLGE